MCVGEGGEKGDILEPLTRLATKFRKKHPIFKTNFPEWCVSKFGFLAKIIFVFVLNMLRNIIPVPPYSPTSSCSKEER